jgi:Tfp pilus assembly protein PilO
MALAGAICIAAIGFYFSWYRPATKLWRDLQTDIDTKNQSLVSSRSKAGELPAVAIEVERLRQQLDRFDRQIPRQQELPQFLTKLDALKQDVTLTKWNLKPEMPKPGDSYSEQSIHVDFQGDYEDVASFLAKVESLDRLTRVRRLALRSAPGKNGVVEVQMDLSIYFLEG